jgi:integrase
MTRQPTSTVNVSPCSETSFASRVSLLGITYPKADLGNVTADLAGCIQRAINAKNGLAKVRHGIAESSRDSYWQHYKRVDRDKTATLRNLSTVRNLRSAYCFVLEQRFLNVDDWDQSGLIRCWRELEVFHDMNTRTIYPNGHQLDFNHAGFLLFAAYLEGRGVRVIGPNDGKFLPRKPRLRKLGKLALNWRTEIYEATASSITNIKEAVLFLALVGCRPSELKTASIRVMEGRHVQLTVLSGKSLGGEKPVERGAVFPIEGPARWLVKLATYDDQCSTNPFAPITVKQLANLLARVSKCVYPKVRPPISSYDFRNAVASDLKAAGASTTEIAQMLGHNSTLQQGHYGRRRHGSATSIWLPMKVIESHQVRIVDDWCQQANGDYGGADYESDY